MSKSIPREYRIYLAIWRKAFLQRETDKPLIVVKASNRNIAISMRQGMYRAISPYRTGKQFDAELQQAAEAFVVHLAAAPSHELVLRPRTTLSELELSLADLGIEEDDLLITEEKLERESLNEFLEGPLEVTPRTSTPFYTREA